MEDSEVWGQLEQAVRKSTCLKTGTAAAVVKDGAILSLSWNLCAPNGIKHGENPENCPRMDITTGTGYELCNPVHAEVLACLNIRPGRSPEEIAQYAGHLPWTEADVRKAFNQNELQALQESELYLWGHYWACDPCKKFLRAVSIPDSNIKLHAPSGQAVQSRYAQTGLT